MRASRTIYRYDVDASVCAVRIPCAFKSCIDLHLEGVLHDHVYKDVCY